MERGDADVLWQAQIDFDRGVRHPGGVCPAFSLSAASKCSHSLVLPINESIWEHGKLLFWPFLLSALWLNRGCPGGIRPWLMVLLGMDSPYAGLWVVLPYRAAGRGDVGGHRLLRRRHGSWASGSPADSPVPSADPSGYCLFWVPPPWAFCSPCLPCGLPSICCLPTCPLPAPGSRFPVEK